MAIARRVYPERDDAVYAQAWMWMLDQGDIYAQNTGYDSYDTFRSPGYEVIDFAVEEDGRLLAFCSLMLRAKGTCQAALIAPVRPRVRSILVALQSLQRSYFTDLNYYYLFVHLPDGKQFDRARRVARLMRWREVTPNYFEYTLADFLESQ